MSVAKEFTLHENHKIEFRVEAFNITNSFRAGVPELAGAAGLGAGGSGVSTIYGTPLRPGHQRARSAAEVFVLRK